MDLDKGRTLVEQGKRNVRARFVIAAAASIAVAWTGLHAQKSAPGDLAASLSGTWKLNRELSDSISQPGRGGRRGGGALFAVAPGAAQRGRGGGGDSAATSADMTPEELAAQAAIRQLEGIPEVITIKATPESVSFSDSRGERTYPVNGKKVTTDIGAAKVNVKNSWDKSSLKQEFSTPKTNLTQTWQVDESQHLVLKTKVESLTMVSKEVKTVFDKQ
jgi:hypothetical protein